MSGRAMRFSIFTQRLDRAVFLAYFLGAVVPLVALGYFFALPGVEQASAKSGWLGEVGAAGLLALLASSGALCLGSFFALRRFVRQTLARLDADRRRLARLVEVSGAVSGASHAGEVARSVAESALALAEARAAFVFLGGEKNAPVELVDHSGVDAAEIYAKGRRAVDAMVRLAMEGGRPALVGDDGGRSRELGLSAGAAVPLAGRGALVVVHVEPGRRFDAEHVDSLTTLAGMGAISVHNADLRDAQQNFFAHMTELVVAALDAYLDLQVGHSRRVAHYANAMGRELGFDDAHLQRLHFASLMHDIGMLRIPREHWDKASANRKHPAIGARMLERIRLWEDLAPFVHHHHEWWDGQGYPDKLAGEAIPLEARIIGIAEAFDSMTSAGYRAAVPVEEALRRVETGAGTQFDPRLAQRFVALVRGGAVRVG